MIIIGKANYMFCVFCGEDSKKISFKEEGKPLLACTSCGKVISYSEIDKAAIETFKAMGGGKDFPNILKEPLKVRIPLILDRHVTYLHVTEKTWERVPLQLYVRKNTLTPNEIHFTPILRIGNNTYEFGVANFSSAKSNKTHRRGNVSDHHIETKKANRKKLLNTDFGYDNDKWQSKPLLKKGEFGYSDEIKAWKELAKEEKASRKTWIRIRKREKKREKTKKVQEKLKEYKKQIKKEAKESELFVKAIVPFVRRSKSKAVNVYQALSNMKWRRISDGKEYSCSWRHAGSLIADIRNKNETYLDFYCTGGEGDVTEEFEAYMKRKGWEKLPWE